MELLALIVASVGIMLASLAGILFVHSSMREWTQSNLKYLITFSSGVFLVVTYNIIVEAFEFAVNPSVVIISVLCGFLFFYVLEKLYPEVHCHHNEKTCLSENNKKGARKVLLGDGLHNIGDGILLAPIFIIDIRLGFIAAIGIFVHEFIQEISEFFVLKASGYSTKQALIRNFLVSGTILVGALGGYYLSSFELLVGPLIGLAAGAFLYLLLVDLIPDSIHYSKKEKNAKKYIAWGILGMMVILSVNTATAWFLEKEGLQGHGHLHEDHLYNEHDEHDEHDEE